MARGGGIYPRRISRNAANLRLSLESTETACFHRNGVHDPAAMEHNDTAPRSESGCGDLIGAMAAIAFFVALAVGLVDSAVYAAAGFLR